MIGMTDYFTANLRHRIRQVLLQDSSVLYVAAAGETLLSMCGRRFAIMVRRYTLIIVSAFGVSPRHDSVSWLFKIPIF